MMSSKLSHNPHLLVVCSLCACLCVSVLSNEVSLLDDLQPAASSSNTSSSSSTAQQLQRAQKQHVNSVDNEQQISYSVAQRNVYKANSFFRAVGSSNVDLRDDHLSASVSSVSNDVFSGDSSSSTVNRDLSRGKSLGSRGFSDFRVESRGFSDKSVGSDEFSDTKHVGRNRFRVESREFSRNNGAGYREVSDSSVRSREFSDNKVDFSGSSDVFPGSSDVIAGSSDVFSGGSSAGQFADISSHTAALRKRSIARGSSADRNQLIFSTENSTVVLAQLGGTATLPCLVKKIASGVVSWLRRKNIHELLTVGLTPYSSDERFFVEHSRQTQNWALKIRSVKPEDEGVYECQVSTHPPASVFLQLQVVEATAVIQGAPDIHVKNGSTLHLVCSLLNSTEPPVFIFWYHGPRMINYDKDPNISVRSDASGSVLVIRHARQQHTGNYTCLPSNVRSASVNVHVLIDETPAAMQDGRNNMNQLSFNIGYYCVYLLLILGYNNYYVTS
uniref:Limbic system-associated membrane protein n=1 Tax=Cacopsylla melanoneura TaxID=428564 RepID=A0A8D8QDL9_9HEMI